MVVCIEGQFLDLLVCPTVLHLLHVGGALFPLLSSVAATFLAPSGSSSVSGRLSGVRFPVQMVGKWLMALQFLNSAHLEGQIWDVGGYLLLVKVATHT